MGPRGRAPEAHPHGRLRRPDLRFPHHGRTRQRPFERRVRRQISPRPRRTQGQMPSHVRHRRARRRSDHPCRRLQDRTCLTHPASPPPGPGKFTSLRVLCKKLLCETKLLLLETVKAIQWELTKKYLSRSLLKVATRKIVFAALMSFALFIVPYVCIM